MVSTPRLAPEVASIRVARAIADESGTDGSSLEALRVVVSELASNAVHHARTPFTVSIDRHPDGGVAVEVHDDSADVPVTRPLEPHAARGRGLQIIEAFASAWGTTLDAAGGKTVWVHLPP